MKRIVLLISALALCVFGLSSCSSSSSGESTAAPLGSENNPVVVGTLATEDILPFWVAEAEELFAQQGVSVDIQVFQSATELIAGICSEQVHFAMTDPMVAASIHASGTEVQITWITLGTSAEQGRFGIMTADPSIASLEDLAGKSIGVGSNTILEYVMDCLIARANIPAGSIASEELQKLPVRFETMASGQVAAAALPASLLALGESRGFTVLADDTTGENISQSVMIARSAVLSAEGGSALLEKLQQAWNSAVERINAQPEQYRALLVEKASLPEAIAQSYHISNYPTTQLPSNATIDPVLAWMQEKHYLETPLRYNETNGCFEVA